MIGESYVFAQSRDSICGNRVLELEEECKGLDVTRCTDYMIADGCMCDNAGEYVTGAYLV